MKNKLIIIISKTRKIQRSPGISITNADREVDNLSIDIANIEKRTNNLDRGIEIANIKKKADNSSISIDIADVDGRADNLDIDIDSKRK